jgi:hypothetical protein
MRYAPRVLPPLSRFASTSYAAHRAPSTPTWDRLTATERRDWTARERWALDTTHGADAAGVIYSADPGDPPPTAQPT